MDEDSSIEDNNGNIQESNVSGQVGINDTDTHNSQRQEREVQRQDGENHLRREREETNNSSGGQSHSSSRTGRNYHHVRPRLVTGFMMPDAHICNGNSRASISRTTIVNLHVRTDPNAEPSMRRALVVQILRIIAHNPHVQNGSNAQTYSRPRGYGPVRPSSMPYTRLFLCRVYSDNEGSTLAYLMESP